MRVQVPFSALNIFGESFQVVRLETIFLLYRLFTRQYTYDISYIIIGIIRKGYITSNTDSINNKTNILEHIRKSIKPLSKLNLIDNFLFFL